MSPTAAWQRVREIVRNEGGRGLLFRSLGVLGYRRQLWLVRALDVPLPAIASSVAVDIEALGEDDADDYLEFRVGATREQFLERIRGGHLCLAARHEGRIASASWLAFDRARVEALARELRIQPDEAYVYDSFTAREWRGNRIQAVITREVLDHARYAGRKTLVTIVSPENRPNLASRGRTGFRALGVIGAWRIGPWRRDFFYGQRGLRPREGASARGRALPEERPHPNEGGRSDEQAQSPTAGNVS